MSKTTMILTAGLLSALLAFPAAAGTWHQSEDASWKYLDDNGTYVTGWIKDNGHDYYLDENGNMLADTITPDGYYVDASGAWNGEAAAAPAETVQPAVPSTVYQPGKYAVGADIPAGEYVLFAVSEGSYPYYERRGNANFESYEDIIDNSIFEYNSIVAIYDGEFLDLSRCTAVPISQVPYIDIQQGEMFKVGYHIAAGTYTVRVKDGASYPSCTVSSQPSDDLEYITDYIQVPATATITVTDGQYLRLQDCSFVSN